MDYMRSYKIVLLLTGVLLSGVLKIGVKEVKAGVVINDSTLTTENIIRVNGLHPHTKYYYTIGDFKYLLQGDENNFFYTLPEKGKEGMYRIGVFGDCGNNSVNQRHVKQSVLHTWVTIIWMHGFCREIMLNMPMMQRNSIKSGGGFCFGQAGG